MNFLLIEHGCKVDYYWWKILFELLNLIFFRVGVGGFSQLNLTGKIEFNLIYNILSGKKKN